MRYAIFSDIHGNWQAWNAVLADMYDSKVDVPVCLGDIVGYGPRPQKVLDGIREVTTNFVMGNHDAAASGVIDPQIFNDKARAVIEWTRDQLTPDAIDFLKDMALVIEDGELLFVHAEIEEPGRFYYIDSEEEARDNFQYCTQRITFVGHTHDPAIFAENEDKSVTRMEDVDCVLNADQRYIINVGSVGEPRNPEDIRARYVIFDTETNELVFRRIEFDIEAYRLDLVTSGLTIKPYFLTVVDSYLEAVEMAKAADGQMMRDMETPVHAPSLLSKRKNRIVSSHKGRPPLTRNPLPVVKKSPLPIILITFFLFVSMIGAGWFFWWLPKQETAGEIAITIDSQATSMAGMIAEELNGGIQPDSPDDEPDTSEPDFIPTQFVEGATINHWNFDRADGEIGEETMFVNRVPGEQREPLIDKVPKTEIKNQNAASGGIWEEPSRSEQYSIRHDRSWTFEGWFQLPEITGLKARKVIAGNRGHIGAGWCFEAREQDGQILNFSYWPDGIQKTGSSFSIPATNFFDDKPHHFAIVWNRNFVAGETGQIRVYIDGRIQSGGANGKTDKKALELSLESVRNSKASDLFAIGGLRNDAKPLQFTGTLDELRFTAGVQSPNKFLLADKGGKLPEPPPAPKPEPPAPKAMPQTEPEIPEGPLKTLSSYRDGMIFYAPFDEPAGSKILRDASGNGRNMPVNGTKISQPGKVGFAVHFQQKGFNSNSIPFEETNNYTLAFWILLDEKQVNSETPGNIASIPGFAVARYDNGQIQFITNGKAASFNVPPDKKWNHFIIQNDTEKTQIYRNGSAKPFITFPQKIEKRKSPANAVITMGTGKSRFHLDEVAIWRRLLTDEERLTAFQLGQKNTVIIEIPKVVSYWKFDEESGRLYEDSIGDLKLGGDARARREEPIAPAVVPLTLEKNTGAYRVEMLVQAPDADPTTFALTKGKGFTYEGWFHPGKSKLAILGRTNAKRDDAVGWFFALARESGTKGSAIFRFGDRAGKQALAKGLDIYDGQPHHFAAVWQATTETEGVGNLIIYVDGVQVASNKLAHSDVIEGNSDTLQIGGPNNDLTVDEIRFTRGVLKPLNFLTAGKAAPPKPATPKKK